MTFQKFDFILRIPRDTVQLRWKSVACTGEFYSCEPRSSRSHKFSDYEAQHAELILAHSSTGNGMDV